MFDLAQGEGEEGKDKCMDKCEGEEGGVEHMEVG